MAKKTAKSETLSIRMDPKTRFMLEFVARLRGQTITTVIERAIANAADSASIDHPDEYGGKATWRDFWSIEEGERALLIAGERQLHPTYEEERRLAFTRRFWPFFYKEKERVTFNVEYLDVLWPHIDHLINSHDEMKATNVNAAPEVMSDMLRDANVTPPQWPPAVARLSRDLDDDIPF